MSSRGAFFGLEIGRTGLTTAQFGLDVTSHNIGNVDTVGYTRQRIVSTAYDPFAAIGRFAPVSQGMVGGGVRVQILDQVRSAFLDRRFRTETTAHAYWETRSQSLSYIESFFDNVNEKTSINYSMAEFFRSMTILATDPISGAPRTLMQTAAMDLVQQLNMMYTGLVDLQKSENKAVATKTNDVNMIAEEIAKLNENIYKFELTGMIANDLRDKRNVLVDQLSELIDIEYDEYLDPLGHSRFWIKIAGNETLVDHDEYAKLDTRLVDNRIDGEDQVAEVYWVETRNTRNELISTFAGEPAMDWSLITGGQLKAHIDVRDGNGYTWNAALSPPAWVASSDSRQRGIPYYIEMVNNLARALVEQINEVHRQGWSDHPDGSRTGIDFFNEDYAITWTNGGDEYEWDADAQAWREWDPIGEEWVSGGTTITRDVATGEYIVDGTPMDREDFLAAYTKEFDINKITAQNISLSGEILASAFNIAASSKEINRAGSTDPDPGDATYSQRHNNENMNKLYAIFSRTDIVVYVSDPNGDPVRKDIGSFDDYGTVIRFDLGNTLHTSKQTQETNRILKLAAENQRTAIAGVSLDEEMVGLIRYQHAYNGAARVITAMDDMLDRLINGTGRVGL